MIHFTSEIFSGQIVYVLLSNYFNMSTLDYILVSGQMQWQNAKWSRQNRWLFGLSCRSAAMSFLGSGVRTPLSAWSLSFVFVVCWIGTELVTRLEESYWVRLCVCVRVCVCVWSRNLKKQSPYHSFCLQHHRKKVT